ncbi:helix-turn-helix domain-containing protein [Arthrobacter globiformis]|uniref:helix-turn-helix domain-containing protein n=1 Tax=Arthrobacter globiformis TaxID=1665 RepID=UPI0027912E8F|nr:helix-turn-helix transcriptional regulator [Arthrobacter globiformis]MDQ0617367.1 transcriptional regulator with XRE-family HTH domain [Arthrobacter globiformis]
MSHAKLKPEAAKALGLRLQNLRVDFGWTQEEGAGLAGISRGHDRTLELGHADYGDRWPSNPTMATLLELARVYRIDPKELIDVVITNSSPDQ